MKKKKSMLKAVKEWEQDIQKIEAKETLFRAWEKEEKKRFDDKCKELEKTALDRAEKKIPNSMDISVLGGGFSFLLEFCTVIVIIFSLMILGILGT